MDAAILVRGLMFNELLGFVHVAGRSICGGDWKAKKIANCCAGGVPEVKQER